MDFDYEGEDYGGRILWSRVGVFVGAALLIFILGRCTAGGGADQAALDEALAAASEAEAQIDEREQLINELQAQNQELRNQVAGGTTGTPGATTGSEQPVAGATEGPGGGVQTDASGEQFYEVQAGDTLASIAQTVYGDPTQFGIIAEANSIGGDFILQEGQTLVIPPNPDAEQ